MSKLRMKRRHVVTEQRRSIFTPVLTLDLPAMADNGTNGLVPISRGCLGTSLKEARLSLSQPLAINLI